MCPSEEDRGILPSLTFGTNNVFLNMILIVAWIQNEKIMLHDKILKQVLLIEDLASFSWDDSIWNY